MDYYERALVNGILGTQRGQQPGVMIYMMPMGPGESKAVSYHGWGNKFDSFWCCYGSGNLSTLWVYNVLYSSSFLSNYSDTITVLPRNSEILNLVVVCDAVASFSEVES